MIEEDKRFKNAWIRAQNDAVEQQEIQRRREQRREALEATNSWKVENQRRRDNDRH